MDDKYITLTWSFIRDKETTMQEKLILMEINNLSMLKLGCIAMNEHFSELLGVKKNAVSRLIASLESKGYITSNIKKGSRNFSRIITINKMLFNPSHFVIQPITKCEETKENITTNKTLSIFDDFLFQLKKASIYKSKVTKTKGADKLFNSIEDKTKLFNDYIQHQKDKLEFSVRITKYLEDYNTVYASNSFAKKDEVMSDAEYWGNN